MGANQGGTGGHNPGAGDVSVKETVGEAIYRALARDADAIIAACEQSQREMEPAERAWHETLTVAAKWWRARRCSTVHVHREPLGTWRIVRLTVGNTQAAGWGPGSIADVRAAVNVARTAGALQ